MLSVQLVAVRENEQMWRAFLACHVGSSTPIAWQRDEIYNQNRWHLKNTRCQQSNLSAPKSQEAKSSAS